MRSGTDVRSVHGRPTTEVAGRTELGVNELARDVRLEPEDLFALRYIRGGCWSPDGRCVAYGVSRTDDSEHFELWIAELASGAKHRLPYGGKATAPAWSPDGNRIAFIGDGRVRVADFPALTLSEALTPSEYWVDGRVSWSPDSRTIAVSLSQRRAVAGPRRLVEGVFRVDGLGFLDRMTQRIHAISLADRSMRPLTDEQEYCSQPQWSSCGKRILFLARRTVVPFAAGSQRLRVMNVDSGEATEPLTGNWYIEAARWIPGTQRIVVAGARDSTLTIPALSLWVVDANDGDAQLRTPDVLAHVGFRLNHDMPPRELSAHYGIVVADANSAFVTMQNRGNAEIWRVALAGDVAIQPVIDGDRACIVLDANPNTHALLYAATDLHRPFELMMASLEGRDETPLTGLNDAVLARWPELVVEPFSFQSEDGLTIDAWFLSGASRKRPMPTVLFIHAGPFMATGNAFRYDFHHLASHGFGIVFANFRGSIGYGEEFTRAISGDWGGRGYPDHIGAVDAAIARGYADPKRLGVWGPSHGGFATCWVIGHTQRFRAAVAESASTNFETLYYLTDVPETYSRELGGRPHEIPEIYRARSPLTYAHRCVTPTLLVHGENDLRCPISEAEQFYRALQDAGCATELVRIPECSHIGDSIGPLSARRAQNEALVSWFNRYL